jgi:hypothetical protein
MASEKVVMVGIKRALLYNSTAPLPMNELMLNLHLVIVEKCKRC